LLASLAARPPLKIVASDRRCPPRRGSPVGGLADPATDSSRL